MLGDRGKLTESLNIHLDWQGDGLRAKIADCPIGSDDGFDAIAEWLATKRRLRLESYCMTSMVSRLIGQVDLGSLSDLVINYACCEVDRDLQSGLTEPDRFVLVAIRKGIDEGFFDLPAVERKRRFIEIIRMGAREGAEQLGAASTMILRACDEVERLGFMNEFVWVSATSPSCLRADIRVSQDIDALRVFVDVFDTCNQLMFSRLVVEDDPLTHPLSRMEGLDWVGDEEVRFYITLDEDEWEVPIEWVSIPVTDA